MTYRTEHDSMGEVRVPADRYWGAQTERSRNNFPIGAGKETMPGEIIRAFAVLKKAAARMRSWTGNWTGISRWWSGRRDPAPRAT